MRNFTSFLHLLFRIYCALSTYHKPQLWWAECKCSVVTAASGYRIREHSPNSWALPKAGEVIQLQALLPGAELTGLSIPKGRFGEADRCVHFAFACVTPAESITGLIAAFSSKDELPGGVVGSMLTCGPRCAEQFGEDYKLWLRKMYPVSVVHSYQDKDRRSVYNSEGKLSPRETVKQERVGSNVPIVPWAGLCPSACSGPSPSPVEASVPLCSIIQGHWDFSFMAVGPVETKNVGCGLLCYHIQSYVEVLVVWDFWGNSLLLGVQRLG